jgi:hypothetical protein
MRYEVRVPGVSDPNHFFIFYSCCCGHVDCVPDKAEADITEARWPAAL